MSGEIRTAESVLFAVLGLLAIVALVLLGAVYARRRFIAHGAALFLCAERPSGATSWRLRLARFDSTSMELFGLGGLSIHPLRRITRGPGRLLSMAGLPREEWPALIDDPVVLRCRDESGLFELALARDHSTAMRSWIESSPPGVPHQAA